MNNNDSQIVKRIQAGDSSAFAELVKKYQRVVHGFVYHTTQDISAVEDITQEVFLDAYLNLQTLQNPEKLGAWLRSIAYYKSVDWIRQYQEAFPLMDDLTADGTSISETLEREEDYERLFAIIRTLSEPHRIVVTLKYLEGLSNAEIADFLEVSQSVVSTRLERARKQLQERMLTALEKEFPKPDFGETISHRIKECRPLIGVGLQFPEDHKTMNLCACTFRARSLAKRTGGVCQEYPGTGLAIWYGMDKIREDDARKAVETALELQKHLCPAGSFSISIKQMLRKKPENHPLFPGLMDMRVRGSSQASDIVVDNSISWLLRNEFHFERIQWEYEAPAGHFSIYRLTLNPPTGTPDIDILVGRQEEIAPFERAIQHLIAGGSGIILLTGEPGIGKTHLLRVLRKRCFVSQRKSLIWLEGKADFGKPHQEIRDAIQSHFGFESADNLREHLASLGLESALPYFAELLRLPFKSSDKKFNSLPVEQIQYRTFQYLRDWLIQLAKDTPVVWVVDDIHWLSSESSRLIQYLCRVTRHSPVLFLFSRRSGYEQVAEAEHGIELESQVAQRYPEVYQQIDLEPLEEWASLSLLYHFLGNRQLLPSEEKQLLSLSAGNPFYLREVAQLLINSPSPLVEIEFGVAKIFWERARSLEALNHLHRALHLEEHKEDSYYSWHFLPGQIYYDLGQYEAMTETFEKALERKEVFGEASQSLKHLFAFLVQVYAYLGDWEKAYRYFWQIVDSMDSRPADHLYPVEHAIGALCHGDKTNRRWTWEGIPQTMARAQELIKRLYEHNIAPEDNEKRLKALHPILAAGYVEYGAKRSHEEGVAMMRLFARQVWILDEHVEFWAYLSGVLNYDALEAIFADALEQVEREEPILLNEKYNRPEFFVSAHPEKLILNWLRACLRERYETDDIGKHLRQMGIIPEPCWLITGVFEENVPAEVEQNILSRTGSLPVKIKWQTTDDFRDGYIDCRHIFQTMDRVSAYACTAILSPKEQQVQFTVYHDDGIRVWLNGETCFEKDHCGYSLFDGVLKQGYNLVLIRLTNYEDGWGFILRVTDRDGEVLKDLTYTQPNLSSGVALSRQTPLPPIYRQQDATDNSSPSLHLGSMAGMTQVPMQLSYWAKAFSGNWEETAEGIKLYGTAYRGGNWIFSKSLYNFVNSQLFVKWMPYGGNGYNYACFTNTINMTPGGIGGSTHHQYKVHRPRIYDGIRYYTRIKVNAGKTYTAVMSTDNYDINGGTVVKSDSGTISDECWEYIEKTNILVHFGDNYASTSTYMIVAEVKTDATPVQTTILNSYDFENVVDVPAQFNFTGNWVIDTVGFNSSKSLHNADSPSSISLKVKDAAAVSFKTKCSGSYSSGIGFYVDGVSLWNTSFLCREILDKWNEWIIPIPGTGTHTLTWSSTKGAALWIDDITIFLN